MKSPKYKTEIQKCMAKNIKTQPLLSEINNECKDNKFKHEKDTKMRSYGNIYLKFISAQLKTHESCL